MQPALEFAADVIIVGAGLSGLRAARSLKDGGLTSLVLDARPRVGGKTWSISDADGAGVIDLGAEWLNDTIQPQVYQLARSLGLEFTEVEVQGEAVLQNGDKTLIKHPYGEQAPVGCDRIGPVSRLTA